MDDSCPATPLVLTETDSKSPLRIAPSSPESDGIKSPGRDSPDSHCVICLGKLQNKSFTDSCLHQFCFQCLLQWSKIKAECPLCKQPFKSIIHNVRSNVDYDQYHVEAGEPRCVLSDLMHSFNFDLIQVDRSFRYRSTMTREYFRELAETFLVQNNLYNNDFYQIPPMVPLDPAPTHNVRFSNRLHSSVRMRGTTEFRKKIYSRDLWVQDLADISGRYRECTPQFYRDNPAQIHRIVPWLNREVNVLLNDCESHVAYILTRIVSFLSQHSIRSREFRELVEPYFGSRTDHFIHELYTFAHSVYDISGFDQHAVYGPNPNYATEVQEISSSNDDDSDIEILETINWKDYKSRKSSKEGFKSIIMKRVRESGAQPDEPVPGPSGILSAKSSEQLEISESDPEEIKVLDYVKPEPEVVVLSSGEDVPALSDSDVSKGECVEVINDKIRKSTRARLSSDEEYAPSSERGRNRSKGGKGKCKSNGFGLKGKQKQKYITSKKYRSCSTDSTSSSSSISTSSSKSSSSVSSIHKSKRKKTKTSRKKCKRKVTVKSLQKVSENKRRKVISSGSDSDGNHSKTKKRVKSCVIVPNTKSSDSPPIVYKLKISSTSNDHELDKNHRYPASYWSTFVNPEYEKSRRRREKSADKKPKQKMCNSSSEDMPSRRVRHSSNLSNSPTHNISADESLSVRRSSKNESSKTSKQFKCHGDKGKRYRDSYYNHNSQSENLPYPCASGSCEASLTFSTFSPSTSHDSMTS